MTISESALSDLLHTAFTTLTPVEENLATKYDHQIETNEDGTTKVVAVPHVEDAYVPANLSRAMADAIANAIQPQLVAAETDQPWFEWNGLDLTQFDPPVVGTAVTTNPPDRAKVVDYYGLKWIAIEVACTNFTPAAGAVVLPITATPPSANYVIYADWISFDANGEYMNPYLFTRFTSLTSSYYFQYDRWYAAGEDAYFEVGKWESGGENPIGEDFMKFPQVDLENRGLEIKLGVEGASLLKMKCGGEFLQIDNETTPITDVGKAAIGTKPRASLVTNINYFRNIRCFEL